MSWLTRHLSLSSSSMVPASTSNESSIDNSSLFVFTLLRFYISTSLTMLDRPDFAIAFSIALCSMSNNNSLANLWFSSANNIKFDIEPTGYTYRVISINPEPISRGYNIFNNKAVEPNIFTWLDTLNSVCNCRLNLVNNLKNILLV